MHLLILVNVKTLLKALTKMNNYSNKGTARYNCKGATKISLYQLQTKQ